MNKQLVDQAKTLWRRIDAAYQAQPTSRVNGLRYRAWRRYQRRVDALLEAHGVGYVDKLPPIFGRRSWREPEF